jgi:hypothetical protein
VGLRIRALLPPQDFLRQKALDRLAKQALFPALIILKLPGYGIQIFGYAIITKGDSYLQPVIHAHTIFTV